MDFKQEEIAAAVKKIIDAVGEDSNREGLQDTPTRVAKMYQEIFSGIDEDPRDYLDAMFSEDHEEIVLVKDIPVYSMCEHHLIPFFGLAHIAYIPQNGRITGLSKLAKAVEIVSKRPQLQERMTDLLADAIMDKLEPLGVFVLIEAEHLCMIMRGVKKPGSKAVTMSTRGIYKNDVSLRSEVMSMIRS